MFPEATTLPFDLRRLGSADAPCLQRFLETCDDYFRLISGKSVGPHEADTELASLPPGKTLDDKFFVGLQEPDGTLAGVFDLIKDYPEPGIWYLGLLLLHPANRSKGHGEAIHVQVSAWVRSQGGSAIRLGVVEKNTKALKFWTRLGYQELARKPVQMGGHMHEVRVLQKAL